MTRATTRPVVLLVCDLGPRHGAGHLMRCLALAEELDARGFQPVVAADVASVPFALGQVQGRGFAATRPVVDSASAQAALAGSRPALVVIDSYDLPASVYDEVRASGVPLLAIVDGPLDGRAADVYLNPNLGGERRPELLPLRSSYLGGLEFALLRDEIRRARPTTGRRPTGAAPRVLLVFGATDPFGAAPTLTRHLAATGLPFRATVVAQGERADLVDAVRLSSDQEVTVVDPTARLAEAVLASDAVVSAAGTTTWELMHLGAASALVRVAENQRVGYERLTGTDAVVGLGGLEQLQASTTPPPVLGRLLTDPWLRARLSTTARDLVDGAGRTRVVDATLPHLTGLDRPAARGR